MTEKEELQRFRMETAGEILVELVKKEPFASYKAMQYLPKMAVEMVDTLIDKLEERNN